MILDHCYVFCQKFMIRNISYKELILGLMSLEFHRLPWLEIYPIRNWYRSYSFSKKLLQRLEIYPIRNWYEFLYFHYSFYPIKLEIYPIRNWYVFKREDNKIIFELEIYPIRNWYISRFSFQNISINIRNISYKELIRRDSLNRSLRIFELEIYPIRNWYGLFLYWHNNRKKLEIYPIRNWYDATFPSSF